MMRMRTTSRVSGLSGKGSKARTTRYCAACGMPMADSLSRLGSIGCHDCRDVDAPLCSTPPTTRFTRDGLRTAESPRHRGEGLTPVAARCAGFDLNGMIAREVLARGLAHRLPTTSIAGERGEVSLELLRVAGENSGVPVVHRFWALRQTVVPAIRKECSSSSGAGLRFHKTPSVSSSEHGRAEIEAERARLGLGERVRLRVGHEASLSRGSCRAARGRAPGPSPRALEDD